MFNNLKKQPERPQMDKKGHFFYGATIGLLAVLSPLLGLLSGTCAAFGKEWWDAYTGSGTPEYADYMYTVGGTSLMVLFIQLLNFLGGLI
jgi:hypothetical protein